MALLPWPDSPCAHGRSVAPGAQQEAAGATIRGRVQEQPVHTEAAEVGDEVRIASDFVRHPKFSSVHDRTGRLVRKGDFGGWWVRFEGEHQDRFCSTGGLSGSCYELCKVRLSILGTSDRNEGVDLDEKAASSASTNTQESRVEEEAELAHPAGNFEEAIRELEEGTRVFSIVGNEARACNPKAELNSPSISADFSDVTGGALGSMCRSPTINDDPLSGYADAQGTPPAGQFVTSPTAHEKPALPPRTSIAANAEAVQRAEFCRDIAPTSQRSPTTPRVLPSRYTGRSLEHHESSLSKLQQDNAELRAENTKCKQALTDMASRRIFADGEAADVREKERAFARETERGLRLRLEQSEKDSVQVQTQMRLDQEEFENKLHSQRQELMSTKSALLERQNECQRLRIVIEDIEADRTRNSTDKVADNELQKDVPGFGGAAAEEFESLRVELARALEELTSVKEARLEAERKTCAKDLELTRLSEELRTRKFTLQRLEASAEEKMSYIRQLEKETVSLKRDVENRNDKIQNLSAECDRIQGECHRFHSQKLDSQKELEVLHEQVKSLSGHNTAIGAERHRFSDEVNRLNMQVRDMQQAQDNLRKQVFDEHKAARDARAESFDLRGALETAREREASLQHDIESLYRQLQDLRVAMEYVPTGDQLVHVPLPSTMSSKIETLSTTSNVHYTQAGQAEKTQPDSLPVYKPNEALSTQNAKQPLPIPPSPPQQGPYHHGNMLMDLGMVRMHANAAEAHNAPRWSNLPGVYRPAIAPAMAEGMNHASHPFSHSSAKDHVGSNSFEGDHMLPNRMLAMQQAYVMKKVQEHKDLLMMRQQQQQQQHEDYFKSFLQMSEQQQRQEQQLPNMAKTPVAPPQERALDHTEWTSNFPLVDMGTAKLLSAPQGILKRNPPFSAGGEAGLGGLEQPSLSANLEFGPAMEQAANTGQTRMVHTMMPGLSRWIKAMPRSPADSGDDKGANVKDSNRPDASLTSLTALSNAASDIKFSAFEVGESSFPIETGVHLDVEHGMKAGGDGEEGSAAAKLAHHHSRSVSPLHQASLTSLMDAGSHEGGTVGVSESSIVSDVSQSRRPVFNGNGFPTVGASGRIDRSDDTASVPRSSSSKGTTDGGERSARSREKRERRSRERRSSKEAPNDKKKTSSPFPSSSWFRMRTPSPFGRWSANGRKEGRNQSGDVSADATVAASAASAGGGENRENIAPTTTLTWAPSPAGKPSAVRGKAHVPRTSSWQSVKNFVGIRA